jgi:hypothetical protein
VNGRSRAAVGLALAGCLLSAPAGCNEDQQPPALDLTANASWNRDPSSIADIGYELELDIYFSDRAQTCFELPRDLRVVVDDRQLDLNLMAVGACQSNLRITAIALTPRETTVVKVLDGDAVLGEATYRNLFPGSTGAEVLSPADGRPRMGETLTISIPTGWHESTDPRVIGFFHWLDPAASVPPFSTFVYGTAAADALSVTVAAPMIAGRAMVVFSKLGLSDVTVAESCTGFRTCRSFASDDTVGPVAVEVIP